MGFASLVVLMTGFLFFENTSAIKRSRQEQIANYSPGEKIPFIMGTIKGLTPSGHLIISDFFGALIKTNLKATENDLGWFSIFQGRLGNDREFLVDAIQPFPYGHFKFIVSIIALLCLFAVLYRNLSFTTKGIRLISPKKNL